MMYSSDYNFCKFKIPSQGARVIWEITNECNYACSYCIFASTGRKPQGELTTQEVFSALQELKDHNFTHIKFTGGEPFLRPDMLDILSRSRLLGFTVDISTNASILNETNVRTLEHLALSYVHVSLDGHSAAIHEAVRGKKSFAPTIEGLRLLKKYAIPTRIGCVIHLHNQDKLQEMTDFAQALGAQELVLSLMEPVGRLRDKTKNLATTPILELIEQIENIKKSNPSIALSHNLTANLNSSLNFSTKSFPHSFANSFPIVFHPMRPTTGEKNQKVLCPGGSKFLFINSLGQVSACTWVNELRPEWNAGKIQHEKLSEILKSENFKKLASYHESLLEHNLNVCPMTQFAVEKKLSSKKTIPIACIK